jgi:DME family drug/metabolite transporter
VTTAATPASTSARPSQPGGANRSPTTSTASSVATTGSSSVTVVATLLAVVVVGERLAPLGWLGVALVLTGVVAVALAGPGRSRLESRA